MTDVGKIHICLSQINKTLAIETYAAASRSTIPTSARPFYYINSNTDDTKPMLIILKRFGTKNTSTRQETNHY